MSAKTILVVDDDVDFVEICRLLLENNGYRVVSAHSGRECLDKLRDESPDLIMLDVMMATVSDGFDVARALRASQETKDIPLLMVTSVNEHQPYTFGPQSDWLPVDEFLEKPVAPQKLLDTIEAWLT